MDELSRDEVLQILELIEKSEFDFFELVSGDLKLTVSKTPLSGRPGPALPPPAAGPPPPPPPRREEQAHSSPTSSAPAADVSASASLPDTAGLVPVNADMVGTYYAQPEPGAPPYIQVGSRVEEDSIVGLIEIMKVFTPVHAGAQGVVARILVQNAQFVQFGQTLLLIEPDEA